MGKISNLLLKYEPDVIKDQRTMDKVTNYIESFPEISRFIQNSKWSFLDYSYTTCLKFDGIWLNQV